MSLHTGKKLGDTSRYIFRSMLFLTSVTKTQSQWHSCFLSLVESMSTGLFSDTLSVSAFRSESKH